MISAEKNYVLGRGKLYLARRVNGVLEGERYIASTDSFSFDVSSDTLDKYDMESGVTSKVKTALLKVERSGSFVTSSIDRENIAMFVLGVDGVTAFSGGTIAGELLGDVAQDRYYQLGASPTNVTGARNVSAVVIKSGATIFSETSDYTVDEVRGRVYIVSGGGIANGTAVTADYVEAAHSREQVSSKSDIKIDGSFRFEAHNAQGKDNDYFFPSVQVTANGSADLKGDDWQKLSFSLSILELNADTSAIYVDGKPFNP